MRIHSKIMGGLVAAGMGAAALVIGAAPASAVGTTGNCFHKVERGVYACIFSSPGECQQWVKSTGKEPTAAGCLHTGAGSHRPDWNNPEGYVGAVFI
ncbi:hypothetical protein AB0L62_18620 [Nocardia asteroides]|uniref:hypothetical protein n=1 Tax=Nocardia asteroides TaxID=1824 RepID=UPI00343810C4